MLLSFGAQTAPETCSLRWHPQKGDEVQYEYVVKTQMSGLPFETTAVVSASVTEVRPDGSYTVKSTSRGALVKMGPNETRDDRTSTITAKHAADGRLISMTGHQDMESYRIAAVTKFVSPPMPVKPTDSWRVVRERDRPRGNPGHETRYVFEKLNVTESKKIAEVTFESKETTGESPRTASGKWTIDASTGQPITMEAQVVGLFPNEKTPATVSLRRIER